MNCIFCCVFNQKKYVDMFFLLLESIFIYGNLDENTYVLVYTSTPFMNMIKESNLFNSAKIKFEINDTYNNIDKACKARLDLFNLHSVTNYNKILYLDTDILIKDDINKVFNVCKEDILYVLEEGEIYSDTDYWGKSLFGNEINNYNDKSAFTSGILLFNNCEKIKDLFNKINKDIIERLYSFICFDQPYIVYNAFKYKLYNNKILKSLVINNDNNIHSDKVIHHFPGGPGVYEEKIHKMTIFLNKMNKNKTYIFDVKIKPNTNKRLPLVGLCVSYNYYDTIQFVLPVNYLHFEKIYVITQEDDIETIELTKQFKNVEILFFDFKNNNKHFDKYGALNYAQQIAYEQFPDSWYLIFDSDIILPNNFIDILMKENLNPECIYGGIRKNVLRTSELLNKTQIINNDENNKIIHNNILYLKNTPPSILGCFQLYKKKVYNNNHFDDAGYGDYSFGYNNFNLFCNLENLTYFHLGETGVNWQGKVASFIDDIGISIDNIYYTCKKRCNNVYYDSNCKIIKYGNSKNIDHNIWTCSEQMRYDIYNFFKRHSDFKIAEIGAHKGYSTRILSNIFSQVYAVDNSIEWTQFNKNFNKDSTNIEYVMLDIYKDDWNTVLPDDIDVSFIDADHSYNGCKSDILNSIKQFKNLKYIIFDDYGVWPGVKESVDELIHNKTLKFERFIGINDVQGPIGIVRNVNEGIICSIRKKVYNTKNNLPIDNLPIDNLPKNNLPIDNLPRYNLPIYNVMGVIAKKNNQTYLKEIQPNTQNNFELSSYKKNTSPNILQQNFQQNFNKPIFVEPNTQNNFKLSSYKKNTSPNILQQNFQISLNNLYYH